MNRPKKLDLKNLISWGGSKNPAFFDFTGNFVEFSCKVISPPGRIALRRRGNYVAEATRRRRRILKRRIRSCYADKIHRAYGNLFTKIRRTDMRLLLAEDEKEMAHALEAVFTHNHYSVDVVYNGIDAADWAESGNYDGMILDIMMPGKSGLEVLSEWTESIHHQIERLNSLVTQLLTLAKMEEGGGKLELKTWNASETIMDAVTSFEAPAVTKQIALHAAERYCRRTPYGRGCRKNPPARLPSCG